MVQEIVSERMIVEKKIRAGLHLTGGEASDGDGGPEAMSADCMGEVSVSSIKETSIEAEGHSRGNNYLY
jgi:hypothetical protein